MWSLSTLSSFLDAAGNRIEGFQQPGSEISVITMIIISMHYIGSPADNQPQGPAIECNDTAFMPCNPSDIHVWHEAFMQGNP